MSNNTQTSEPKYKFGPHATFGDLLGPAMEITDQDEADAYFEALVQHCMSFGKSRQEGIANSKINLGYWTGYYDSETAERVFRLFKCGHPVFGTSQPTAEEAFKAGVERGGVI